MPRRKKATEAKSLVTKNGRKTKGDHNRSETIEGMEDDKKEQKETREDKQQRPKNGKKKEEESKQTELENKKKLQRKRKSGMTLDEKLDCVDGDVKEQETSKIMKLEAWPVQSERLKTRQLEPWPKRNENAEHISIKQEELNVNRKDIDKSAGEKVVPSVNKVRKRKSVQKPQTDLHTEENKKIKLEQQKMKKSKAVKLKGKLQEYLPVNCNTSLVQSSQTDDSNDFEPVMKIRSPISSQTENKRYSAKNNKPKAKASEKKTKSKKQNLEIVNILHKNNDIEKMSDGSSENEDGKIEFEKEEQNNQDMAPVKLERRPKIDMGDVTSVLLMMEGVTKCTAMDDVAPSTSGLKSPEEGEDFIEGSSEEEVSDWEEVEALPGHESPKKFQSGPIEITVDAPEIMKKRKKKEFDVKAFFQRQLNRFQKELRENLHKVHLMCLLARGMYLNSLCQDELLQAQILSLLPPQFIALSKRDFAGFGLTLLGKVLAWFGDCFSMDVDDKSKEMTTKTRIERSISTFVVPSYVERAVVLVLLLRSLGLFTRLVISLQPMTLKPSSTKEESKRGKKDSKQTSRSSSGKKSATKDSDKLARVDKQSEKKTNRKSSEKPNLNKSEYFKTKNERLRTRGSKVKPKTYKDSGDEIEGDSEDEYVPSEEEKERRKGTGRKNKNKGVKSKKVESTEDSANSSSSDFEEESFSPRSPVSLVRKLKANFKNRKVVSSDTEAEESSHSLQGCNFWAEVYLESEDNWMCIDCTSNKVDKPHVIESKATKPLHYVISFDNDGYVKDLTPRYASKWLTETRKLRTQQDWLEETINPYKCPDADSHAKENDDIQASLLKKPLPTSVGELKNHPLYVLKRHLLKFEALYPNTAIPVGYIKNEPIYARECVHTLHSRENWLKEGRAVRIGEEAYKMVKSRARWNRKKENPDALDLELFGHWQTEVYIPPPAVNGKVPRNGYGNIELFMPSMLPAGTVHLKLPGLNKVARKLDIDCVAAMTGWDTHCGYSHPVLDGFVVCEEFKDILIAAWDEDQEIQKQREAEKREKRVLQNWQLLTKGLLIKEKLKRKYLLQPHLHEEEKPKKDKKDKKHGEKSDDLKKAWPMNKEGSEALSTAKHFETETL